MASALAAWQLPTKTRPRLSAAKPATSIDTSLSVSSGVSSSATSSLLVPAAPTGPGVSRRHQNCWAAWTPNPASHSYKALRAGQEAVGAADPTLPWCGEGQGP